MSAFYDFVRGRSDSLPEGHSERGMLLYRHLVWLGVSQMIESQFPSLREQMGETAWLTLTRAYVAQSTWTSPHCQDIPHDFPAFVAHAAASLD